MISDELREEIKARSARAAAEWPDLPEPVDFLDEIAQAYLRSTMEAFDKAEVAIWYGGKATDEQLAEVARRNRARERAIRDSGGPQAWLDRRSADIDCCRDFPMTFGETGGDE